MELRTSSCYYANETSIICRYRRHQLRCPVLECHRRPQFPPPQTITAPPSLCHTTTSITIQRRHRNCRRTHNDGARVRPAAPLHALAPSHLQQEPLSAVAIVARARRGRRAGQGGGAGPIVQVALLREISHHLEVVTQGL